MYMSHYSCELWPCMGGALSRNLNKVPPPQGEVCTHIKVLLPHDEVPMPHSEVSLSHGEVPAPQGKKRTTTSQWIVVLTLIPCYTIPAIKHSPTMMPTMNLSFKHQLLHLFCHLKLFVKHLQVSVDQTRSQELTCMLVLAHLLFMSSFVHEYKKCYRIQIYAK